MAKQKSAFHGKSLDYPINKNCRIELGEHPVVNEDRDNRIRYLNNIINFIPHDLIDLPEFGDAFMNKAWDYDVFTYAGEILENKIRQKWQRKLSTEEYLKWHFSRPEINHGKSHYHLLKVLGATKGLSWQKHKLKRAFLFFDCLDLILTVTKSCSSVTDEYIAAIADLLAIDAPELLLYIQKHIQNHSDPEVDYKNIYHEICVLSKKLSNQNVASF